MYIMCIISAKFGAGTHPGTPQIHILSMKIAKEGHRLDFDRILVNFGLHSGVTFWYISDMFAVLFDAF